MMWLITEALNTWRLRKKKKKLGEGAHPLTSQAKDQTQATAVTQAAAVAKQDP